MSPEVVAYAIVAATLKVAPWIIATAAVFAVIVWLVERHHDHNEQTTRQQWPDSVPFHYTDDDTADILPTLCDHTQQRIWARVEAELAATQFEKWAATNMADACERHPDVGEKLKAEIAAQLRAGRTPISHNIHRHPSGVIIDIVCAEDAHEQAAAFLAGGDDAA